MILNYLDELLDNILNLLFFNYLEKQTFKIKKNQDIEQYINEAMKKVNISELISNLIKKTDAKFNDKNHLKKLNIIYSKYLFSYLLIFIGVIFYEKLEQEFTNLVIFSYNSYLETYFTPKINSLIISLRKLCIQILFISTLKKDKIKLLPNKEFAKSVETYEQLGETLKESFSRDKIKLSYHNLIKILLIKEQYLIEDKWTLTEIFESDILSGEYRYIDVYIGDTNVIDFSSIKLHYPDYSEVFKFIEFLKEPLFIPKLSLGDKINFLLKNDFIYLITDEYARYNISLDSKQLDEVDDGNMKDNIKIKNILKKVNDPKNKELANKNELWYSFKKEYNMITYNLFEELKILGKITDEYNSIKPGVQNKNLYDELLGYQFQHFFEFDSSEYVITVPKQSVSFRKCNLEHVKESLDLRNIRQNEDIHVYGIVLTNMFKNIMMNERTIKGRDIKEIKINEIDNFIPKLFEKEDVLVYLEFKESININSLDNIYELIQNILFKQFIKNKKYYELLDHDKKIMADIEIFKNRRKDISKIVEQSIDLTKLESLPLILINKVVTKELVINKIVLDKIKLLSDEVTKRCNHFLILEFILKNRTEQFTQLIFEFSKRYAVLNQDELMICKSCGTYLEISRYIASGTIDLYSGEYIITNIIDNTPLFNKQEYLPYYKFLKQIDKLLDDKISKLFNMIYISGNETSNIRKRESLLKDIIDLLNIHNIYLRDYILVSNKFRGETKTSIFNRKDYNIDETSTFLFAFKLDNNILLRSSDDIDKFKVIKYHNILVYIILILVLDLTESNIISLVNNHKTCNIEFYEKSVVPLCRKLKVIINSGGDTIALSELNLFGYLITIFSCIFIEYGLYQDPKQKKDMALKLMITTCIDLLNTILFINTYPIQGKSYIYQLISYRFYHKVLTMYKDNNLFTRIKNIYSGKTDMLYKSTKTNVSAKKLLLNQVKFQYYFIDKTKLNNRIKFYPKFKISKFIFTSPKYQFNLVKKGKKTNNNNIKLGEIDFKISYDIKYNFNTTNIDNLIDILNKNIKNNTFMKDIAIINHDHLGLKLDKSITINWNELKFKPYDS